MGYRLNLEDIKKKVSLYAQFVVNKEAEKEATCSTSTSPVLALRGVLKTNKTDKELLDDYFRDRYGL